MKRSFWAVEDLECGVRCCSSAKRGRVAFKTTSFRWGRQASGGSTQSPLRQNTRHLLDKAIWDTVGRWLTPGLGCAPAVAPRNPRAWIPLAGGPEAAAEYPGRRAPSAAAAKSGESAFDPPEEPLISFSQSRRSSEQNTPCKYLPPAALISSGRWVA